MGRLMSGSFVLEGNKGTSAFKQVGLYMLRKRLRGQRCVCFCCPGYESCKCLQREELCVFKKKDRCRIGVYTYAKNCVGGKCGVCLASSPLTHAGMCRMIEARSVAECKFSC